MSTAAEAPSGGPSLPDFFQSASLGGRLSNLDDPIETSARGAPGQQPSAVAGAESLPDNVGQPRTSGAAVPPADPPPAAATSVRGNYAPKPLYTSFYDYQEDPPSAPPETSLVSPDGMESMGTNSTSILAYLDDTPESSPGPGRTGAHAIQRTESSLRGLSLGTKPGGAEGGVPRPKALSPIHGLVGSGDAATLAFSESNQALARFHDVPTVAPASAYHHAPAARPTSGLPSMDFGTGSLFGAFQQPHAHSCVQSPDLSCASSLSSSSLDLAALSPCPGSHAEPSPASTMFRSLGGDHGFLYSPAPPPAGNALAPSAAACADQRPGFSLLNPPADARGSLRVTAPPFKPSGISSPTYASPQTEYNSPQSSPDYNSPRGGYGSGGYDPLPLLLAHQPPTPSQPPPAAGFGRGPWGDHYGSGANAELGPAYPPGSQLQQYGQQQQNHPNHNTAGSLLDRRSSANSSASDSPRRSSGFGSERGSYGGGGGVDPRLAVPAATPPYTQHSHPQQPLALPEQHRAPPLPLPPQRGSPPASIPGAMGGPWNTTCGGQVGLGPVAPLPAAAPRGAGQPHQPMPAPFGGAAPAGGGPLPAMDPQATAAFGTMCQAAGLSHLHMLHLQHLVMKLTLVATNKQELRKVLQGFLSQERVAEAHVLVGMMRMVGLPVDVVMYNLLMTAYKKRRQWQLVMQVMQQMRASGIVPDVVSYNILIDSCGKAQQLGRAFECYDEMVRHGLKPGVNTYTSLIDACGKTQQLKKANELLSQMQTEGVQPNAHTFTTIINACAQAQDLELGLQVLDQMIQSGAAHEVGQSTITPYTTLIRACGKALAVDKAFQVVRSMLDVGLKPNTVTFNCLIDACSKANELDRAFQVLRLMYHYDNPPDAVTYTALIDACVKGGELARAFDLLLQMQRDEHTPPSNLYTSLLDACLKAPADLERAFEVLHCMGNAGMRPAAATFTALVHACGRAANLERAFDVLRYMKVLKVRPTAAAHTALIDACVQGRDLAKAMAALQEMLGASDVPEPSVFNSLIELCRASRQLEYALQLFLCMKQLHAIPNSHTFRNLIGACLDAADVPRAELMVQEMTSAGYEPDSPTAEDFLAAVAARAETVARLPQLLQRLMPCVEPAQRSPLLARLVEALAKGEHPSAAIQIVAYLQAEPTPPSLQLVAGLHASLAANASLAGSEPGRRLLQAVASMLPPAELAPAAAPAPAATPEPPALSTQ